MYSTNEASDTSEVIEINEDLQKLFKICKKFCYSILPAELVSLVKDDINTQDELGNTCLHYACKNRLLYGSIKVWQ